MPFKARLKLKQPRTYKKTQYRVTNWSEYNQSLKKRGCLSLYFPYGNLSKQFINEDNYIAGVSGRSSKYTKLYAEVLFIFYKVLGMGLRQLTGYIEDIWRGQGEAIGVPSFGHLSDLFRSIPLEQA